MNCNEQQSTCTRKRASPRTGCQDCEFTIQYNIFRAELEKELKTIRGTTREQHRKWKAERMLKIVNESASLANSRKGFHKNWPETVALFVSLYRDEVARIKMIDNWNLINSGPPKEDTRK